MTSGTAVLRALGLGDLLTAVPAMRAVAAARTPEPLRLLVPARFTGLASAAVPGSRLLPTEGLHDVRGPYRPALAVNLHGPGPASTAALARLAPDRLVAFARHGTDGPVWCDDEHETERWCRLVAATLGAPADPGDLHLPVRCAGRPARPTVIVHVGAAAPARRWWPQRFAAVARWLVGAGCRVVVTGDGRERARCEWVRERAGGGVEVAAGASMTVADLCAHVAGAQLVVTGDTGVAHLATAYRTPSVVLFGPVSPQLWGPRDRTRHTVIWHGRGPARRPGDPAGDHIDPLLAGITAEEVVEACAELLDRHGGVPVREPLYRVDARVPARAR